MKSTPVVVGVALLFTLACAADLPVAPDAPAEAVAPAAPQPAAAPPPVAPLSQNARIEDEQNSIAVFRAVANAAVNVTQNQLVTDRWSTKTLEVPAGTGTGFVWDAAGHVVTNYHVVDGARSLTVTLFDQSTWPAKFVGGDPRKDIAVLQIEAPGDKLVPIQLPPDGYTLEVGQKTLAIGNPFGLDHTLTTGVVSALGREVMGYGNVTIKGMIQTDASINPGNSGGPLLDSQGRLIGMNTMIFSQAGQSAGIGFAVPSATIARVVTQVIATGKVEQMGIGVSLVDDRIARRNGIRGVAILEVAPGTPAAEAGLVGLTQTSRGVRLGDVIVAVDGQEIASYDDLYNAFDQHHAGDTVQIGILREKERKDVTVAVAVVNGD